MAQSGYILDADVSMGVSHTQYPPFFVLRNVDLQTFPMNARLLDVGCGMNARTTKFLQESGISVVGVDRDLAQEESCKDFLFQRDAHNLPLESNYFDLAFSHMSTYNIFSLQCGAGILRLVQDYYAQEIVKILSVTKEILRVLRVGGELRISPDPDTFLSDCKDEISELGGRIERRELCFDGSEIETVLRESDIPATYTAIVKER